MKKKPMVNLHRLEKLLAEKNWGAGELAAYSGVKYDTVYSLKSGRRPNTRAETLKRIADALDTSVDYLLGESDNREPPEGRLPEPIRRLAAIAERLSETRQEELLEIAASLEELQQADASRTDYVAAIRAIVLFGEKYEGAASDLLPILEALRRSAPPRSLDGGTDGQCLDDPGESD